MPGPRQLELGLSMRIMAPTPPPESCYPPSGLQMGFNMTVGLVQTPQWACNLSSWTSVLEPSSNSAPKRLGYSMRYRCQTSSPSGRYFKTQWTLLASPRTTSRKNFCQNSRIKANRLSKSRKNFWLKIFAISSLPVPAVATENLNKK